ncbi:hypothetical protein MKW92_032300, partial [Papaver armeniacum]
MESPEPLGISTNGNHHHSHRYFQMRSEPSISSSSLLPHQTQSSQQNWIFDELPKATVVSVSRPDAADISPFTLSYTVEFQYKQFKWQLLKKATQVIYLHIGLKKRALIQEFQDIIEDKQEQ